jgi:hypothetical protein
MAGFEPAKLAHGLRLGSRSSLFKRHIPPHAHFSYRFSLIIVIYNVYAVFINK